VENLIVRLKRDKPHWGARKLRDLLIRRLAGDIRVPAIRPWQNCVCQWGLGWLRFASFSNASMMLTTLLVQPSQAA
jgi:hypothetical protein